MAPTSPPEAAPALPARGWSLRRRLLAISCLSVALAWLAGGAAIYHVVQNEDTQLFDGRLRDIAQTLLAFAEHEVSEIDAQSLPTPAHVETEGTASGRLRYQVWSRAGRLLLSSTNASQRQPLMPLDAADAQTRTVEGVPLRVVMLEGPGGRYRVQVAEPLSERLDWHDLLSPALGLALLISTGVLLPVALLLNLTLAPMRRAAEELTRRGPADLREVRAEALPREIAPLLDALNRLLRRLDLALRGEREFVSAAAHELRTPLAGVQAQAQLAAHERTSPQQRQEALRSVQDGVDHAAHLVSQLLDLARGDVLAGDPARLREERRSVDVHQLFIGLLADLGPAAAQRGMRFREQIEVPTLQGSEFGLRLILRNLLANAVAYAAPDTEIRLGTRREGAATVLWVADHGPGIALEERSRIFDRFYRGAGNRAPGCGLGLSIVKAVADAHGATIRLGDAPGGGLLAEVVLPAAAET